MNTPVLNRSSTPTLRCLPAQWGRAWFVAAFIGVGATCNVGRAGDLPAASGSEAGQGTPGHWAFQTPVRPAVPQVKNRRWVRNPIDAFVLARLESEGITPSPEAERRTLVRRLYLDLLGLPPSPEAVRDFVDDPSPRAYERLVDSLLGSPHFGERWGRHWLDLARYADSSGYQVDRPRPAAYHFRDWVINSLNDDQAFDQFTIEQLAGDLLPNATTDQIVAAGFHRMTLSNHEDGVDAEEFDCKAKVDRVSTTGTVWLGLTLGCAECHNHKYDPITQREFYQLYSFFNNADEVEVPVVASAPEGDRPEGKLVGPERSRSGSTWEPEPKPRPARNRETKRQPARRRVADTPAGTVAALSFRERTNTPQAFVHVRGDFLRRGEVVGPGTPAVLPRLQARASGADRLDLARWIVDPANPLTARVFVNQFWLHLFGRGLVNTPEDFGTRGEMPSHPALLDWLAVAFASESEEKPGAPPALGWSRKGLIRLIVTSATYRQSSCARPELQTRDPLNILLARQGRLRVESEVLRDLNLAAGGLLNEQVGGPSFHPYLPEDLKQLGSAGAFSWVDTEGPEKYRRGLYIYAQRTVPYPTAMTFDQADPTRCCAQRERSDTPLQALTLMNHGLFIECAQGLARRLMESSSADAASRIRRGFEISVGRPPAKDECERLLELRRQLPEPGGWVALSQVLLNLDEFMTRE